VGKVIFKSGGFTIDYLGDVEGEGPIYNVWGPKGELIRGNRSSIWDAAVEMDKYNLTGGYKKWGTVEGLVRSKTFYHGWDIDPELRNVIRELDTKGFVTLGSCAGHAGEPGFITFEKRILTPKDRKVIRYILEGVGIKVKKFENAKASAQYSKVDFEGVGEEIGSTPFWLR